MLRHETVFFCSILRLLVTHVPVCQFAPRSIRVLCWLLVVICFVFAFAFIFLLARTSFVVLSDVVVVGGCNQLPMETLVAMAQFNRLSKQHHRTD